MRLPQKIAQPHVTPLLGFLPIPAICAVVYAFLVYLIGLWILCNATALDFYFTVSAPLLGGLSLCGVLTLINLLFAIWLVKDLLSVRHQARSRRSAITALVGALLLVAAVQVSAIVMSSSAESERPDFDGAAWLVEEGQEHERSERYAEAFAAYREAQFKDWSSEVAKLRLTWLMASCPDRGVFDAEVPDMRMPGWWDGSNMGAWTNHLEWSWFEGYPYPPKRTRLEEMQVLDAWAALKARQGDYREAEAVMIRAIAVAESMGIGDAVLDEMNARLGSYQSDQPWTSKAGVIQPGYRLVEKRRR